MTNSRDPGKATPLALNVELPTERIHRVVEPVTRFLGVQSASGGILLASTMAALFIANTSMGPNMTAFWEIPFGVSWGAHEAKGSLKHWINEGLMVIFFFVVGLELKREFVLGELNSLQAATLPLAAAAGGMIVPAGLYLSLQWGGEGHTGWGIPMATDIAFMVACLKLLGTRIPAGLRVLLLSLAVVDDLGAVLVIAFGYSNDVHLISLFLGLIGISFMMCTAWLGVRSVPIYFIIGILIWFAFHESGVHATIVGVIIGLLTPVEPWISEGLLARLIRRLDLFFTHGILNDPEYTRSMLKKLERAARESISPLERLEVALQPWVGFLIIPLFALANAGVQLHTDALSHPVTIAIAIGLAVGKPAGVIVGCLVSVYAGITRLPKGVTWKLLAYSSILTGIGFTMSLFIADLALQGTELEAAKVGILAASALCALVGMGLMFRYGPHQASA